MRTKSHVVVFCAAIAGLMPVNLVHGQAIQQPGQSAAAPKTEDLSQQNLRNFNNLTDTANKLQKRFEDIRKQLDQKLTNFTEAENVINGMLEGVKSAIDAGDPNGVFIGQVEQLIAAAESGINQAQSRNLKGLADKFEIQKKQLQSHKNEILRLYPRYMNMYSEIEKRKGDLALAKKFNELEEASKIVGDAVQQYKGLDQLLKDVIETFPKPFEVLTQ